MEYPDFMLLFCWAVQDIRNPVPSLGKIPFSSARIPQTITNTGSGVARITGSWEMEREKKKKKKREGTHDIWAELTTGYYQALNPAGSSGERHRHEASCMRAIWKEGEYIVRDKPQEWDNGGSDRKRHVHWCLRRNRAAEMNSSELV